MDWVVHFAKLLDCNFFVFCQLPKKICAIYVLLVSFPSNIDVYGSSLVVCDFFWQKEMARRNNTQKGKSFTRKLKLIL